MYHLSKSGKGFLSLGLYRGRRVGDSRQGFGVQLFPNGCLYVGGWGDNRPDGLGMLILRDGTFYEGEFEKGVFIKGTLTYFNGAKFSGIFDGTNMERFRRGTFHFASGERFVGEWVEGLAVWGKLTEPSGRTFEFREQNSIFSKETGQGVIVSGKDKWLYEGGISGYKTHGAGVVYTTFEQHYSAQFREDKMDGPASRVLINFGEISEGNYASNKKVGVWSRLTHRGFLLTGDVGETNVRITFPYLHDDYIEAEVPPNWCSDKKPYQVRIVKGIYHNARLGKSYELKDIDPAVSFVECWEKNSSFENSFAIISTKHPGHVNLLAAFVEDCLKKGVVEVSRLDPFFHRFLSPESEKALSLDLGRSQTPSRISARQDLSKSTLTSRVAMPRAIESPSKSPDISVINFNPEKSFEKKSTFKPTRHTRVSDLSSNSFNLLQKEEDALSATIKMPNSQSGPGHSSSIEPELARTRVPVSSKPPVVVSDRNEVNSTLSNSAQNLTKPRETGPTNFEGCEYFEGVLLKGKKHGMCRMLEEHGVYREGFFKEGIQSGWGQVLYASGIELGGEYRNGILSGEGWVRIESEKIKGVFLNGSFQAERVAVLGNGVVIAADEKSRVAQLNGEFTIFFVNGYRLIGPLEKGEFVHNAKYRLFDFSGQGWIGKIVDDPALKAKIFLSLSTKVSRFRIGLDSDGFISALKG